MIKKRGKRQFVSWTAKREREFWSLKFKFWNKKIFFSFFFFFVENEKRKYILKFFSQKMKKKKKEARKKVCFSFLDEMKKNKNWRCGKRGKNCMKIEDVLKGSNFRWKKEKEKEYDCSQLKRGRKGAKNFKDKRVEPDVLEQVNYCLFHELFTQT